ncbi:ROK family protein [Streptomyces sp. ALI-76-A]|uniref:ROK family protein n=1 Tax=Streptomyces sp. ALI-76-A TaxID=3025736 RepID=UPI00256EAF27|nr:ROK family protein [Streptomyces sp. ALI-76-A]MDL5199788.1 ROK family protein [Streptomyces sp. ALI-76-A]
MRHVIAVDVGGTLMKAGLITEDGTLLYEERRPTGRKNGPESVLGTVVDFVGELRSVGNRVFGSEPAGVGIGVPGVVCEQQGEVILSANLGWRDTPIGSIIGDRLGGVPVAIGHDMRVGGLAEGRLGAARGLERFLFMAIGTGIAAAIALNGRFERGAHGYAGEVGHVVVRPGGRACGCGQSGCLETISSAAALAHAWAQATGDPNASARDLTRAVEAGDTRAAAIWDDGLSALADALIMCANLLDPEALIIGGGLAEAGDTLFVPLRQAVADRGGLQNRPPLIAAALGDNAGCLGAGLLAWDLVGKREPGSGPFCDSSKG